MQVFVRERREGKTTALVDWLLEGHRIPGYPGWSRVIVCNSQHEVVRVTNLVREKTQLAVDEIKKWREGDFLIEPGYERSLHDRRKAVWSFDDLATNMRGGRDFEYAIDDIDLLLARHLFGMNRPPSLVAMTGELYVPRD